MTSSFGKYGASSEATAAATASRNNCSLNVSTRPPSRCARRRAARSRTCFLHYSRMTTSRLHLQSPRKKSCHSRTKSDKSTPYLSQELTKVEVQAFSPHLFFILSFFMLFGTLRRCRNHHSPRPRLRIFPFRINAHVQIPGTPEQAS